MLELDQSILAKVEKIQKCLIKKSLRVATAESLTGGLLASVFTAIPGSSNVYNGGVTCYTNEMKSSLLGLDPAILEAQGAVNQLVAVQMSEAIRARCRSDFGLSTTGVAGPSGGSEKTPVGTVWVGWSDSKGSGATLLQLVGDRESIRAQTVVKAFEILEERILRL